MSKRKTEGFQMEGRGCARVEKEGVLEVEKKKGEGWGGVKGKIAGLGSDASLFTSVVN